MPLLKPSRLQDLAPPSREAESSEPRRGLQSLAMPEAKQPGFIERAYTRLFNDPDMARHFNEQTVTPNQDIIKDYLKGRLEPTDPTYIEAMKWAVKEDAINDPRQFYLDNPYADPRYLAGSLFKNAINKEKNKQELEKTGVKRF